MANEKKNIEVDGRSLAYELCRHHRAKRVSVRVRPGTGGVGRVVLTVPRRGSVRIGEDFLRRHAEWVFEQVGRLAGRESALTRSDPAEYRKRHDEALGFVRERVEHWNRLYGFTYGIITIRDQKTRWGSCSRSGNLSFSWKLLLLPERLADYVVVHELCHLAEFNHSNRFWALVARTIPEYQHIARELRKG